MAAQTCIQCNKRFNRPYVMKRPFCGRGCREDNRKPCVCRVCGVEFKRTSRRTRVLCDGCKPEGNYPAHLVAENAQRAKEAQRRWTHACRQCGKVFVARQRAFKTFCGRTCAFTFRRREALVKVRWLAKMALRPKVTVYRKCVQCGVEMLAVRGRTMCGDGCRKARTRQQSDEHYKPVHPKQTVCAVCGGVFTTTARKRGVQVTCGPKCADRQRRNTRATLKKRRRARKKGAMTERVDCQRVFERDAWMCGICGDRIDRRTKYPHAKSAVLDHIVPLAKGGEHSYRNTQCAHHLCNSTKGSNEEGAQLRLTG